MFEKTLIPVENHQCHGEVHSAIALAFTPVSVPSFLKSVQRAGLRIRDFEGSLNQNLLGSPAAAAYSKLGNADRGQIREFYLASVERVCPELRAKFFKLYAYY